MNSPALLLRQARQRTKGRSPRAAAFTLVELLTVVFIISLLIAILVPSLSAARTQAKRTASAQALKAIETGLEMFRQENESDFSRTNGYPPSFFYPGSFGKGHDFTPTMRAEGRSPFHTDRRVMYGAMWLPAMLTGFDQLGYIKPGSVPNKNELRSKPEEWYKPDPMGDTTIELSRSPFYVDPDTTRTLKLRNLPGREPEWWRSEAGGAWASLTGVREMPVIVDSFDYPILYYAAQRNGRPTNMVEDEMNRENEYAGGPQRTGPPYFFHSDNHGFTGHAEDGNIEEEGWNFNGDHPIAESGGAYTAADLIDDNKPFSFAKYIIDRKILRDLKTQATPNPNTPLRPVNADSFLLISPGPDGQYGTTDDVSNMPAFLED